MRVFPVMRTTVSGACGLALLLLMVAPAHAFVPYFFTQGFLHGRWTFNLSPAKSFATDAVNVGDPAGLRTAPRQDILRVGTVNFDGVMTATGHTIATTDDNNGSTVMIDFLWSGTYVVNNDGTGVLNITTLFVDDTSCSPAQLPSGTCATFEGPEAYTFSISKKYGIISFVQQDNAGGGAKIFLRGEAVRQSTGAVPLTFTPRSFQKRWAFQLAPAKSFAAAASCGDQITNYSAACDPAGLASAPRQDVMRVGVMDFDGGGNVSGHTIATTDDNSGSTVIVDFNWSGTYSLDTLSPGGDGTGVINIGTITIGDTSCNPSQLPLGTCASFEGPETYAFTYSKTRQRLYLTQTDNVGGGAKIFMRGEADLQ